MVAGLEQPTAGHDLDRRPGRDRHAGAPAAGQHGVPELRAVPAPDGAARTWRSGCGARGPTDVAARAWPTASTWSSCGHLADRKPAQLSGGQQQRVALARAIVNRPALLLLDEPLGALDLKLRRQMQLELKRIQTEVGLTFVHVTHDQEEAMTMADTVAVMNDGPDRADGRARPTCTSCRAPRSSPTSSASPTWCAGTVVERRPTRAARGRRRAGTRVLVPAGARRAHRGRRARRRPAREDARCSSAARTPAPGENVLGPGRRHRRLLHGREHAVPGRGPRPRARSASSPRTSLGGATVALGAAVRLAWAVGYTFGLDGARGRRDEGTVDLDDEP